MKKCSKCLVEQDISNFSKRSRNKDGLQSVCKTCSKTINASYYSKTDSKKLQKRRSQNIVSFSEAYPLLAQSWSSKNDLPACDVASTSYAEALFECKMNHTWVQRLNVIIKNGDRLDACFECKEVKNNFAQVLPDYISWWNNDIPAERVARFSKQSVSFECPEQHIFTQRVKDFTGKCITCNSIGYKFPELAKQWDISNSLSAYEVSYNSAEKIAWKCLDCDNVWETHAYQRANSKTGCPECYKRISIIFGEKELSEWVQDAIGIDNVILNDRHLLNDKEVDIYIPSKNLAIEYNGLYWHSDRFVDKNYHYEKWKTLKDQGIQLISIWEDDFLNRREVVEKMLLHKLGISSQTTSFARKLKIVSINFDESNFFLNENHIQGAVRGSFYLSLQDGDGNIVAVSVWKKLKNTLYLERYATNSIVVGGLSKLLQYVTKHYSNDIDEIVTFAAHDVSFGDLYTRLGFSFDKELTPDYMYVINSHRVHKFNYRISRFKKDANLLFKDGYSENELAALNGLLRVWDCGKTRFILTLDK